MPKLFINLMEEVIHPGLCIGCGACIAACPSFALQMEHGQPVMKGRCEACYLCYYQCPFVANPYELERQVFGRNATAEEVVGIYKRAFSAQALAADVRMRGQDGGAVTALLAALLKTGFIDGAVAVGSGAGEDERWQPTPKVATTRADLLECAGTKYSPGPALIGLRDAVDLYSLEEIALVGTPCQIKALRQMQTSKHGVHRLADAVKFSIGIFCMRTFSYDGFFKDIIEKQLDMNLAEIDKFDIKHGRLIIYRKGKPKRELVLDALARFTCQPCKLCGDFAAELADISIGAVGSPLSHSTVLLRTPIGLEAFERASESKELDVKPLDIVKPGIEAVRRLSMRKKDTTIKEIQRLRKF